MENLQIHSRVSCRCREGSGPDRKCIQVARLTSNNNRATLCGGSTSMKAIRLDGVCNRTRKASTLASSNILEQKMDSLLECPPRRLPPSNLRRALTVTTNRMMVESEGAPLPNMRPALSWRSCTTLACVVSSG